MVFVDILFAILFGALLTVVFSLGVGRRGPWANAWAFFLIVFLAAWAGGTWVRPFGPSIGGVYWLPFLGAGLLIALLMAAVTPPPKPPGTEARREEIKTTLIVEVELFFWIAVLVLLTIIAARYFLSGPGELPVLQR